MTHTYKILVLSDGETWELARGSELWEITEPAYGKLLDGGDASYLKGDDIINRKKVE